MRTVPRTARFGVAALALAALAAGPAAPAVPRSHPGWTGFAPCTQADLAAYSCGTLSVRLDRTPGTHDRRTLALSVLEGGNPDARRTLLMLTGGPGQPGPALAPRVMPMFDALDEDYRIVMLDQRGTGDHPLRCSGLQDQRGGSDLAVPTAAAVRACASTLGPARAHYATTDSVADLEDLRRALGVRAWAVDGVSYGTYTGQRYAAAHPQRVTHLVLDSIVPVTGIDAELAGSFAEYARVMRDVCAAPGRDCPSDPAEDLHTVLEHRPELGPRLLDLVTSVAYADPASYFDLPERLHAGAAGDLAPLDEAYDAMHAAFAAPAEQYSQGIQASTFCLDLDFPWGGAQTPEQVRARLADASVRRLDPAQLFPFNAEAARSNGLMTMCQHWPRERDRQVPRSRLSLRGVDALLLAGERDLGTPLVWARTAHRQIPGSRLVVVPDAGHSIQASGKYPDVNRAVADFLLSR